MSSGSAIGANVSRISDSRVLYDQPAPILPFYSATYLRTKLYPLSRRIDGSAIPVHRRKAAAPEPQLKLEAPEVQNGLVSFDMYAA